MRCPGLSENGGRAILKVFEESRETFYKKFLWPPEGPAVASPKGPPVGSPKGPPVGSHRYVLFISQIGVEVSESYPGAFGLDAFAEVGEAHAGPEIVRFHELHV